MQGGRKLILGQRSVLKNFSGSKVSIEALSGPSENVCDGWLVQVGGVEVPRVVVNLSGRLAASLKCNFSLFIIIFSR